MCVLTRFSTLSLLYMLDIYIYRFRCSRAYAGVELYIHWSKEYKRERKSSSPAIIVVFNVITIIIITIIDTTAAAATFSTDLTKTDASAL